MNQKGRRAKLTPDKLAVLAALGLETPSAHGQQQHQLPQTIPADSP